MEYETINILELLPQKPPFVMVDTLKYFDFVVTRTGLKVTADNIFVENCELSECGVIENIAQTCAARIGYINKYLSSSDVKIGFIGSIRDLSFEDLPKVGDELNTTIEVVNEVFSITLVNAKVEIGSRLIASCEMKIAISDING